MNTSNNLQELIATLEPVKQLVGNWKGTGSGGFPTMSNFTFQDEMIFSIIESAYREEPLVHFQEIASIHNKDGLAFKHWETGFFRPIPGGNLEFQVVHNTGRIESFVGSIELGSGGSSFEMTLESSFLRNAEGLTEARQSKRIFRFDSGKLLYRQYMTTNEVAELLPHLDLVLDRSQ